MSILYTQCLASELAKPANQIVVMGTSVPTVAPVGPVRFFVNTATTPATLYYWTGTSWILVGDGVGSGGGGAFGCADVLACIGGGGGGTGVTFATAAEVIAGVAGGVALSPASLVTRENMPPQTGVSANVLAIPAPGPNQSMWAQNTLGESLHYAPGGGWKIVSDKYRVDLDLGGPLTPTPSGATIHTWVAPRSGIVALTGRAIFHGNPSDVGTAVGVGFVENGLSLVDSSTPIQQFINGAHSTVSITYELLAGDVVSFSIGANPPAPSIYADGCRVSYCYVD